MPKRMEESHEKSSKRRTASVPRPGEEGREPAEWYYGPLLGCLSLPPLSFCVRHIDSPAGSLPMCPRRCCPAVRPRGFQAKEVPDFSKLHKDFETHLERIKQSNPMRQTFVEEFHLADCK